MAARAPAGWLDTGAAALPAPGPAALRGRALAEGPMQALTYPQPAA